MSAKRPNVVYILGDDQRAEYLGSEGHEVLRTPNLDRLAAEGTRFSRAFCTSPACTPSRTCHYTGQWERRHGINFNSGSSLSPDAWEQSFPMRLKQEGYFLGWIGKNHVPAGGGRAGYDSGYFERVFDYWYGNHGHSGFYPKEHSRGGRIYRNAAADTQVEVFTEGALDFLRPDARFRAGALAPLPERPEDRPFCLCVTFNLPHAMGTGTMQLRPGDDDLYRGAYRDVQHRLRPPPTYMPYADAYENPRLPRSVYCGRALPSYDYVRQVHTLRERQVRTCQTVEGMDRFVGRLRETLSDLGLADNTILVFSTDHGLHHGEHGLGGKCFLYEEDLRIPLIVCDPRLPRPREPRVRGEPVVVPDLAPTVLDLCGVETPRNMQGRSLRPLLEGQAAGWRSDFFAEQLFDGQNYPRSECVRSADWKYIRYFARTEDPRQSARAFRDTLDNYLDGLAETLDGRRQPVYEELYHLAEDPGETTNLAADPDQSGRLHRMRDRLMELGREALGGDGPPRTLPFETGSA